LRNNPKFYFFALSNWLVICFSKLFVEHNKRRCPVAAKEEKVWVKEAPSGTEKSFETTFKGSPNQPLDVWPEEEA